MIAGTQKVRLICLLIILCYKISLPWIARAGYKIKIFQVQFSQSSRLRCLHPDSAKSLFSNHLESTVVGLELTSESDRNSRRAGCDDLTPTITPTPRDEISTQRRLHPQVSLCVPCQLCILLIKRKTKKGSKMENISVSKTKKNTSDCSCKGDTFYETDLPEL